MSSVGVEDNEVSCGERPPTVPTESTPDIAGNYRHNKYVPLQVSLYHILLQKFIYVSLYSCISCIDNYLATILMLLFYSNIEYAYIQPVS